MSCGCHKTKNGEKAVKATRTRPLDQCAGCAQKHYDEAWGAWNEFTYTDENRRWVRASLRAVVLHTFRRWPLLARKARELALLVQENRDEETGPRWEELSKLIDAAFLADNPEAAARLETLRATSPVPRP